MKDHSKLFEAGKIGDIEVKNRIFMSPLTRNRAYSNGVPKEMAIEYYSQRATAGLIVTEATQIDPIGKGYLDTPGIYNDEQVLAWAKISQAIHDKGGKVFMQLWHVGRISHTSLLPFGEFPVAPSAIVAKSQTFTAKGFEDVSQPRELSITEIKDIVDKYAKAAKRALEAGFDGVEIHGGNGYLLNQFIATNSNHRKDEYGASVVNRARFLLEVIDAVSGEIGSGRVGVHLSPTGKFNDMRDEAAQENYTYIYDEIEKRKLAYLHVVEKFPGIEYSDVENNLINNLRDNFSGNYLANGGYDANKAEEIINKSAFAVTFGRPFISNPDLPERIKAGQVLVEPDEATFYGGDERGYSDYPNYSHGLNLRSSNNTHAQTLSP